MLGLDDALDRSVGGTDDPPVPRRVKVLGGQQRGRRPLRPVGRHQLADQPGRLQRDVAREHDDGAAGDRIAGGDTAAPVPSPSRCSATATPSGSLGHTVAGAGYGHDLVGTALRAASTTHCTIGLPHTGCSTLGSDERIRVPFPAA